MTETGSRLRRAGNGKVIDRSPRAGGFRAGHRFLKQFAALLLFAGSLTLAAPAGTRAATVAGVTDGALAVGQQGQASYSIPIKVPPGVAGMAPSLSLEYSSGGGNGLVGMGWGLGGLSSVHRCVRTIAQDGAFGGVNFDADDRFCLDGQRLVAISGTYGAHGTEYRTEIESFTKIVSYGTAAAGPAWFRVWTRSGQVSDYGATADARVEIAGRPDVYFWAVNRIADTVGNALTVSYFEDAVAGAHHVERIDYTENSLAGVAPQSAVEFLYESRPDMTLGYVAGAPISSERRLAAIQTLAAGALVRDYRLAYETGATTGRSLLISVTECDGAGDCLRPTEFTWEADSSGWQQNAAYDPPFRTIVQDSYAPKGRTEGDFLDVNGDGLLDFVKAVDVKGTSHRTTWLNTGGGWEESAAHRAPLDFSRIWKTPAKTTRTCLVYNPRNDVCTMWKTKTTPAKFHHRGHGVQFVDLNGDGLTDMVQNLWRKNAAPLRAAYLSTGSGWQSAPEFIPPDLNWTGAENHGDVSVRFVDVNGDGLVDFIKNRWVDKDRQERAAYLNTGSGWQSAPSYIPPGQHWTTVNGLADAGLRFADINGDGLVDLIKNRFYLDRILNGEVQRFGEFAAFLNSGSGWQAAPDFVLRDPDWTSIDGTNDAGSRFFDVNGDGSDDFIKAQKLDGSRTYRTLLSTEHGWRQSSAHDAPLDFTNIQTETKTRRATPCVEYSAREFDCIRWETTTTTTRDYFDQDLGVRFVDLNSDGLTDIVKNRRVSSSVQHTAAYINTGNGWRSAPEYIPPPPMWTGVDGYGDAGLHMVDLNGDGSVDLIKNRYISSSVQEVGAYLNTASDDRIVAVTDSLGAQTSVSYASLTDTNLYEKGAGANFPVRDVQTPHTVVSEVSTDDGVGGQARASYAYGEARVHVQGRGFLGFGVMHSTNLLTGITITTRYRQDYPFIGRVSFSETYLADDTTLKTLTNSYAATALNGGLTSFPHVTQSVAESYEINDGPNNTPITTGSVTSSYDDFGNVTSMIGTTSDGGGQSFVTTTSSSYDNDTVNWFLGRVRRTDVTQQLPDDSASTRSSAFAYDPVTGLLMQEVIEPDRSAFKLATDYTRDIFGNIVTTTVSGGDIQARTTTTSYSPDGRFPEVTTNALGHSETTVYDPRFGVVISQTGPNGFTTTWKYDGFGRKLRENAVDGTATVWEYRLKPPGTTWHEYYILEKPILAATGVTIGPINLTYFDSLNRVTLTRTDGFDGTFVYVNTNYNERGEVSAVSRPYFGTAPAEERQWTTTAYDVIGRPTWVVGPDGGVTAPIYDGLTTTTTNALNQTETRTKNAIGQLIQVTDNAGRSVSYSYDHHGNLTETNVGGVVTTMDYDIRGRKTAMDDPDMGVWSYAYNVLSELVSQTDAKSQTIAMAYDELGRMTSRTEPEGTTTWTYDNPLKTAAIGKPDAVSRSHDDYAKDYTYDALGRASETTVTYEAATYTTSSTYNSAGRLATLTYPSGFAVERGYNAFGYLEEVRELGGAGTVYWRAVDVDAEGRTVEEQLGNGLTTLRDFDPADGLVRSIATYNGLTPLQDLTFNFDKLGNLISRGDGRQSREETFTYDGLNRLTDSTLTDTALLTQLGQTAYAYDALGNLTSKSDVGAYFYGAGIDAGPHAVTSAGGKAYAYDANGAMTSTATTASGATTRSVSWSSFNKPVHITAHDRLASTDLVYGPDRGRIKQTVVKSGSISTISYVGGIFEKHTKAGKADKLKHFISAGGTVAIYTMVDDGNPASDKTRYLHRDHLGSIDLVTKEDGTSSVRRSHEAFGQLRKVNWQTPNNPITMWETPRGFTGHEHLDSVGLIHMNGRVYDPGIGRFLSADPFVQFADNLQSYNRYSYVLNNPLSFTDPSGFGIFKKVLRGAKRFVKSAPKSFYSNTGRIFIAIHSPSLSQKADATRALLQDEHNQLAGYIAIGVASGYCGPAYAACLIFGSAVWGAAIAHANGADVQDTALAAGIAGGSAAASAGIGAAGSAAASSTTGSTVGGQVAIHVAKTVAHGVVQGVGSKLQGGSFRSGFLAGAVAEFTSPVISAIGGNSAGGMVARTAVAAVVGGISAELGGGKFMNGAISAAFVQMFNAERDLFRELERNARHELGVQAAIADYAARGYGIVEAGSVAVDIAGFPTPRFYDFIVYDPVAKVNIGVEVKTTIRDVIRLSSAQVAKDVQVMASGGLTRVRGIPVRGVGYQTFCFGCDFIDVRSIRLRDALIQANVPFHHGGHPGGAGF